LPSTSRILPADALRHGINGLPRCMRVYARAAAPLQAGCSAAPVYQVSLSLSLPLPLSSVLLSLLLRRAATSASASVCS
jgi:hypothetical protein